MTDIYTSDVREALKIAPYRRQQIGAVTVGLAYLLQTVACGWEVFRLTASASWVGLMTAAPILPLPFLSLFAGMIADRIDRRLLVITSTSFMSMTVAAMAIVVGLDLHTPTLLITLAMVTGIGIAFFDPSWLASIADLVPKRLVSHAVALNSTGSAVVWAAGSAAGGALVATIGVARTLMVASAGYAFMALATSLCPKGREVRAKSPVTLSTAIFAGVRYVVNHAVLISLILVVALFALSGVSLQMLLPVFTVRVLGGDSTTYALLLGSFGLGSIVGLLTRRRVGETLKTAMIPVTICAFGSVGGAVAFAGNARIVAVLLVPAGAFWTWILATIGTNVQLLAPPQIRARVLSLYALSVLGSMSIGSLIAGAIGGAVGPRHALMACSTATLLVGLLAARFKLYQAEGGGKLSPQT